MKKNRLLNDKLSYYVSKLGHGDLTCVADCGLPIPNNLERIDLSIERGKPNLFEILDVISSEAVFEKAIIAKELENKKLFILKLKKIFANIQVIEISHEELKNINCQKTKAIIRTGENTPYNNVILVSGVFL